MNILDGMVNHLEDKTTDLKFIYAQISFFELWGETEDWGLAELDEEEQTGDRGVTVRESKRAYLGSLWDRGETEDWGLAELDEEEKTGDGCHC
uniref:Uncharacterized protein n=1 Tax=Globodera pallida TaxID=36090 RepID=A0A183BIE7_GLOPA